MPIQEQPIKILEIPVINIEDIKIIKAPLDDYRQIWRRKIGNLRCVIHHMPPGVRGFGIDLFMQGNGNEDDLVFLQGCCREFIDGFFEQLKLWFLQGGGVGSSVNLVQVKRKWYKRRHYGCPNIARQSWYYSARKFYLRTKRNQDSSSFKAETALLSKVRSAIVEFTQSLSSSGLRPAVA